MSCCWPCASNALPVCYQPAQFSSLKDFLARLVLLMHSCCKCCPGAPTAQLSVAARRQLKYVHICRQHMRMGKSRLVSGSWHCHGTFNSVHHTFHKAPRTIFQVPYSASPTGTSLDCARVSLAHGCSHCCTAFSNWTIRVGLAALHCLRGNKGKHTMIKMSHGIHTSHTQARVPHVKVDLLGRALSRPIQGWRKTASARHRLNTAVYQQYQDPNSNCTVRLMGQCCAQQHVEAVVIQPPCSGSQQERRKPLCPKLLSKKNAARLFLICCSKSRRCLQPCT